MKKVLLTSAAVLAVFASSAAVFADGELGANRWSNESGTYVEDNTQPATVDSIKAANDKDLGDKSEQWTRQANPENPNHKGEKLKVEKGEAEAPKADENKDAAAVKDEAKAVKAAEQKAPAAAKADAKTLPNTAAVK